MSNDLFNDEERNFVYENYKGIGPFQMVKLLNEKFDRNFTVKQLRGYYKNHHLNSGITGYFEKGHIPQNKGKKQTEFMSPESIERTKATRFQKGNIPANHREVGSERITKDGYIEVKVAEPNKWKLKQRLVWQQANGEIPKGSIIRFLDGNKLNCSLENLMIVSKAEHLEITRHGFVSENPEITKAVINIAKLNVAKSKIANQEDK